MEPVVAIIPVKSFRSGKQRLTRALDDESRRSLIVALARHVASTVESAGLVPLIVTADPEVAGWATATGFPTLADPGEGLDGAAHAGVEWARHSESPWLVLHGDLPMLTRDDVMALQEPLSHGLAVLSPSADGGTSAIGAHHEFSFGFGVGSFQRHLARLAPVAIVARPGLALDIDSPHDLEAALGAERARWLEAAIR